jgi:hypothetical protein
MRSAALRLGRAERGSDPPSIGRRSKRRHRLRPRSRPRKQDDELCCAYHDLREAHATQSGLLLFCLTAQSGTGSFTRCRSLRDAGRSGAHHGVAQREVGADNNAARRDAIVAQHEGRRARSGLEPFGEGRGSRCQTSS